MVAVIVTHDRPALLRRCLEGVLSQVCAPHEVVVVDNASAPETAAVLRGFVAAGHPVHVMRLPRNGGGAGGFCAGMGCALDRGADWLWLMDDDGVPAGDGCLRTLLATAEARGAELVGALVVDADAPERLAFPVRLRGRLGGRTVFDVATLRRHGPVDGFAHLFNGALASAGLVRRIGAPDPRFFIRGDEVEFLLRARRAGAGIVLDTGAAFLHPGSAPEIHPILGGRFYAVVPDGEFKQFHQFRNRGYIFRRYGMWGWLLADVARYGCHFLGSRHGDWRGYARWARATAAGVRGRFMRD